MHALPLFYPSPCMTSPYFIPPHACPPFILSHPMHALPLFYPSPCTPSPYSIPPYACHPAVLSQPLHTLPLFYSIPCMPSPNSIPAHAHPPPIIFHPMHAFSLFYPTLCMPSSYSLPAHACPPISLSHTPWRHVSPLTSEYATFESAHTEYIIIIYLGSNLKHQFMTPGPECLLFSFTWTHHIRSTVNLHISESESLFAGLVQ